MPKKTGGSRTIAQPSRKLKTVQLWLLRNILDKLAVSSASKGFQRGDSIEKNAQPHVGSPYVLSLDIEDFFPSIKANRVYYIFRTLGYSPRVSASLTSLCTFKGSLPQGSPCSPKLANLVSLRLDQRILGYVGKRGIVYTRYADDLTLSSYSRRNLIHASYTIREIVKSEGLGVNEAKTRFTGPSRAHRITGLVVTAKQAGIGREKLRAIRAGISNLCKVAKTNPQVKELARIQGYLAFVFSVDKLRYHTLSRYILVLKAKYPDSCVTMLTAKVRRP